MISSVCATQASQSTDRQAGKQNSQPASPKPGMLKDSIELSPAARKALAGDADSDGDTQ